MNDTELQQQVRDGNRDAFAALYKTYNLSVYRQALDAFSGEETAARTVVKDVFADLYRALRAGIRYPDLGRAVSALTQEALAKTLPAEPAPAAQEASDEAENDDEIMASRTVRHVVPAEDAPAPAEPPLLRARERMERENVPPVREQYPVPAGRSQSGNIVLTGCIVVFLLLFLWILAGILMSFGLLPELDLGFSWFNRTFFTLFAL